jgi:hypothetical protein
LNGQYIVTHRVARRNIFKTNISIGVIFEDLGIENGGICILWSFGIFYGHMVNFVAIW